MNVQTRYFPALISELLDDENHATTTSQEQKHVEQLIRKAYDRFEQLACLDANLPALHRAEHVRYIEAALQRLSAAYECLDSSRPWLLYWILNAGALLGHRFDDALLERVVAFLVRCRCPATGGFGGGPGQMAHLAPTYAAVSALCLIGGRSAWEAIDRRGLLAFLGAVRQPADGAFVMHVGGESDIRGVYCAVAVAKLVRLERAEMRQLFAGTVEWISRCQTYEGGIGGAPGLEAHGGYTFCGVAALALLGATGGCDLRALMRWSINRQMRYEGGFQGRSNKLVDGCYSYWQGAVMPIVQALLYGDVEAANAARNSRSAGGDKKATPCSAGDEITAQYRSHLKDPLFDRGALQEYVLICCQRPTGGLVDKPGKPQDLYHTCYTLSGLAIAQHCELDMYPLIIGDAANEVCATHPLYNIPPRCVWQANEYFQQQLGGEEEETTTEASSNGNGGANGGGDSASTATCDPVSSTEESAAAGATASGATTTTVTTTSRSSTTTATTTTISEDEETQASN